jgi:lipopolysaccharide/colanic/teichoic acid biosynthesis glycosyltransferase
MTRGTFYAGFSRSTDFALALGGIVVLAPMLGLIATAVAADSGRPIFYRGLRVGRGGKLFRMVKFRTMVRGADRLGSSLTRDSDDRVTGVGRFLRRWKLDEFPQLWNVLKGEMSFVGPRPDAPEIIQTYTAEMKRALEVRPGLTSLASLWLRNETELLRGVRAPDEVYERIIVPAKVELALTHVDRRSVAFDWGILIATIGAWLGVRSPSDAERQFLTALQRRIAAYGAKEGAEPLTPGVSESHSEGTKGAGQTAGVQER